ncbi:restriction endonuclease subunit S [Pseudoalteromonas ruthenica]|uniref:restriction endonuclease subunit S n=1 Tax=Pseudoalteromonas ruthenica TaxID=151081 RepID=UPI00034A407D|nr:restriction endonuclease subunit S [Pseudoalteromonas ruthenica]
MGYEISTFSIHKLSEYVTIQPGFAFKSKLFLDDSSQTPLVKGENLQQGYIDWGVSKYWSTEDYESLEKYHLLPGDIVLAMDRPWVTAGLKWSYIKSHDPKSLLVQRVARLRAKKGLTQDYLRVLISSNYFASYIQPIVTGVNVPHISGKQIGDFNAPIPSEKVQTKIASLLISYDEKIENNKRRITLLENMAEELYKEWFVRLRFKGYKSATFNKGIPESWTTKTFREIVSYYIGGGWGEEYQTPTFSDSAYVIRGTDIPKLASGDYSNQVQRFHKPSNLESRKLEENDFVFEVSGGSKDQLLGRNLMVSRGLLDLLDNSVMCASFCKQIRFDSELVSPIFMKYFLKLYYECELVGIYQVQSTGISNYQFESFLSFQTIILPDSDLQKEFEKLVKPLIEQQDKLALENLNLEKNKSMLLPRLISGKLSVENLDIESPPSMREIIQ